MRQHKPHLVQTGDKFTRLTVLGFSHSDKRWRRHYLVKCSCGVQKAVQGTLLRSGNTTSCGCLATENKRATRLPNDAGVIAQIILQYRRHARGRSIDWNLSFDEVDRLVRSPCRYCGIVGGNTKKTKNHTGFRYNGIDRVDSAKHYSQDNVVACCGVCNLAKRDTPHDQFIDWIFRVAAHQDAMAEQWGDHVRAVRQQARAA